MLKISDFLTALAGDDQALQDAWKANPKRAALEFGLNNGQATALEQAVRTCNAGPLNAMMSQEEGKTIKVFLWIK